MKTQIPQDTDGIIPQDILFKMQGELYPSYRYKRYHTRESLVINRLVYLRVNEILEVNEKTKSHIAKRIGMSFSSQGVKETGGLLSLPIAGLVKFFVETKIMPNIFFLPIIRAFEWYRKEGLIETIPLRQVNLKDERFFK